MAVMILIVLLSALQVSIKIYRSYIRFKPISRKMQILILTVVSYYTKIVYKKKKNLVVWPKIMPIFRTTVTFINYKAINKIFCVQTFKDIYKAFTFRQFFRSKIEQF